MITEAGVSGWVAARRCVCGKSCATCEECGLPPELHRSPEGTCEIEYAAAALLGVVEAVLALAAEHEQGALRWADPLLVPGWIPLLRGVISSALPGEGTDGEH
jgi:hypothetical protein